ncbi:MAG: PAS domain-containing protein [Myxococcales bacterium]|nr:PAS domain-containing protein [Myxococcales bacterium]
MSVEATSVGQELLRKILDALPSPVFVKDQDHRFVLMNRAGVDLVGVPLSKLVGKTDYDFFPKEEADVFWKVDETVLTEGTTVAQEESLTAEGQAHWLLTTKSRCRLGDGNNLLVGVIQDITHRKLYEESLEQRWEEALAASQTKSLFLAKMSHELRTPLNAIIGYGEILRDDCHVIDPPQLQQDAERVVRSATQLLDLINDILDLARIESGRTVPRPTDIDLACLLQDLDDIMVPLAAKRSNRYRAQLECVDSIVSDERMVRQILINLLANANKYTENGEIELRVHKIDDGVSLSVRDTGHGIPAHMLESVFEPFVQATSRTRPSHGVGLGLAITQGLVSLLGGRLGVSSTVGVGSTFTLLLPDPEPVD